MTSHSVAELERQTPAADPSPGLFQSAELIEFLEDPIAYGQYDWADPISLDEFLGTRAFRGTFVAPLVF